MIIIIVVLFILIISYLFRVFFELNKFCVSYRHLPHSDSSHFLFGDATILIKAILGLTSIPLHDGEQRL